MLAGATRRTRPLADGEPPLRAIEQLVLAGWRWEDDDAQTTRWFPQGISSTHDATAAGRRRGRELAVVSWALDGRRGARISVVELDGGGRYAHIALALPVRTAFGTALAPVRVHAGGIAWHGDRLWVADTLWGLRAFSFERILRTPRGEHVMPQVGAHRLSLARVPLGPRFSFLSLDRTDASAPSLLSGEYRDRRPGARLVRWPPPAPGRAVAAASIERTNLSNLQGALAVRGATLAAASSGTGPGRLAVLRPGAPPRTHPWATGPEDLALLGGRDLVLSLTERPAGSCAGCGRVVFGVSASALLG